MRKFNRKIEFVTIFGKVVAKNRAFGNNIINNFFRFRGGGDFRRVPLGYATVNISNIFIYSPASLRSKRIFAIFKFRSQRKRTYPKSAGCHDFGRGGRSDT